MKALGPVLGSQRKALAAVGVSRSTWHYRSHPRAPVAHPVPHRDRAYRSRVPAVDRERIAARIQAGWKDGHSVDHSFAVAWDTGIMLGSRRTWWRVAADIDDQSARPVVPARTTGSRRREKPVLVATGPGQVYSWDITDLRTPYRGQSFKGYSVIDVYSRKLLGKRCETREADHLAVELFQDVFDQHGTPTVVHADSGPAMRSNALHDELSSRGVEMSHNRPYTSNDNPYSESEFRTMKYRPNYPGTFESLQQARDFTDSYTVWYNEHHRHSGIALFTPNQVHDGTWRQTWDVRDKALQAYYAKHPERFHTKPRTPRPAETVGINNKNHQPNQPN